jgi:hypothetical protein
VISSWIAELVLQDNQRDVTMVLGDGKRYRVNRIGPGVYQQWMQASSKGRFWHDRIKNQYTVTRLI